MNKLLFSVVAFWLGCSSLFGQLNWEKMNGPSGAAAIDFAQDSTDNLWAILFGGTGNLILLSSDDGQSWQPQNFGALKNTVADGIEVSPSGQLFVHGKDSLFRSDDGGASWIKLDVEALGGVTSDSRIAFLPNGNMLMIGSNGLFESMNAGQSWVLKYSFPGHSPILFEKSPDGSLFVVCNIGNSKSAIWRSVDNGVTFLKVYETPIGTSAFELNANGSSILASFQGVGTIKSTDGGDTWQPLFSGTTNFRFARKPNALTLASSSEGLFLRSDDDGASWDTLSGVPRSVVSFDYRMFISKSGSVILSAIQLYRTANFSDGWTVSSSNIFEAWIEEVAASQFSKAAYAIGYDAVYRTVDFGESWARSFTLLQKTFPAYGYLTRPSLHFDQTGTVFFEEKKRFFRSSDEGQTWQDITPPDPNLNANNEFSAIGPDGQLFVAKSFGKGFFTKDQGNSWSSFNLPATNPGSMAVVSDSVYFFSHAFSNLVYRSVDAGGSWTQLQLPAFSTNRRVRLHWAAWNELLLFHEKRLFRSKDYGATWTQSTVPFFDFTKFHTTKTGAFYAWLTSELWFSDDFGLTWAKLASLKLKDSKALTSDFAVSDGNFLFAATSGESVWRSPDVSPNLASLTGHLKKDQNHDCALQPTDLSLENWLISASDTLGNAGYATTDSAGFYRLGIIIPDSTTTELAVEVQPPNYLWQPCDSVLLATVSPSDDTASGLDFPIDALVDCPLLDVSVGFWPARPCFSTTAGASWCNLGTVPATDATISVVLDPAILVDSTSLPILLQAADTLVFALGTVGIGACGQVKIFGKIDCDVPICQSVCIEAFVNPDSICGSFPDWSGAELRASAICEGDSVVDFSIKNIGDAPSTPGLEYIVIEDQILLRTASVPTLAPNAEILFSEIADGSVLRLEVEQEPGHPLSIFSAAWVEGCGADGSNPPQFGWILPFLGEDGDPFSDHFCRETTAAYDPNAKEALPRGIGSQHFIMKNQALDYTIFFQNTGNDTAFQIVLRDTISSFLDLTTLRMGASSHPFEYEIYGAGILKIIFKNILLPDSTTNEIGSHGWVSFKIDQKNDLALGSVIRNKAGIYFDFNAPILTNETWHTVGEDFLTVSVELFEHEKMDGLRVAPNPFSEAAFFELKNGKMGEPLLLKIADPTGRVVRMEKVTGPRFEFLSKNLAAGIWFFELENAATGERRGRGKMVVR